MSLIQLWTDGSSSKAKDGRGFDGGWGFVALHGERRIERYGGGYFGNGTISAMEILAIYAGLSVLLPTGLKIQVFSDSKYAVNALTLWVRKWRSRGWLSSTGKPVRHRELIEGTAEAIERHRRARSIVELIHVRGHRGLEHNERADALAREGRLAGAHNIKSSIIFPNLEPYSL